MTQFFLTWTCHRQAFNVFVVAFGIAAISIGSSSSCVIGLVVVVDLVLLQKQTKYFEKQLHSKYFLKQLNHIFNLLSYGR